MKSLKPTIIVLNIISMTLFLYSCSNDDNLISNVFLTQSISGDIGGYFAGNGHVNFTLSEEN